MKKLGFKKVWAWPSDVETWVKERSKGFIVNACAGSSPIGHLRIDIDQKTNPDLVFDLTEKLPTELYNKADTVVCDPPWRLPHNKRHRLHRNLKMLLKEGGELLFNAPWLPWLKGLRIKAYWIRIPKTRVGDCSIWSISQKNNNNNNNNGLGVYNNIKSNVSSSSSSSSSRGVKK